MVSDSPQTGPVLRPVAEVRDEIGATTGPGARVVIQWFAALSDGRIDDAMALMVPDGPYFLLRARNTVTNAEFGKILGGMTGSVFTQPIAWSLGDIIEQDGRVAIMAGSYVPLVAGGTYENLYLFMFNVKDGLITGAYEFPDTARSAQTFAKGPGQD
jgi:ketosteroid isomerase-like protein